MYAFCIPEQTFSHNVHTFFLNQSARLWCFGVVGDITYIILMIDVSSKNSKSYADSKMHAHSQQFPKSEYLGCISKFRWPIIVLICWLSHEPKFCMVHRIYRQLKGIAGFIGMYVKQSTWNPLQEWRVIE